MTLTLDIANELYPLYEGDVFTLAIARNLVPEEIAADDDEETVGGARRMKKELWRSQDQGLAADYEYVMYGKVSIFVILQGVLIGMEDRDRERARGKRRKS